MRGRGHYFCLPCVLLGFFLIICPSKFFSCHPPWASDLPWTTLCSSFSWNKALSCVQNTLWLIRLIFNHYGMITFNLTSISPLSISVRSCLFSCFFSPATLSSVILPVSLEVISTISPLECQDLFVSLGERKVVLLSNKATQHNGFFLLF